MCGGRAAVAIALYLIVVASDRRPDVPLSTDTLTTNLDRTDTAFRTKATNQLIAKIKELPTVAMWFRLSFRPTAVELTMP